MVRSTLAWGLLALFAIPAQSETLPFSWDLPPQWEAQPQSTQELLERDPPAMSGTVKGVWGDPSAAVFVVVGHSGSGEIKGDLGENLLFLHKALRMHLGDKAASTDVDHTDYFRVFSLRESEKARTTSLYLVYGVEPARLFITKIHCLELGPALYSGNACADLLDTVKMGPSPKRIPVTP